MPVIVIHGIPAYVPQPDLKRLTEVLAQKLASVKELGLRSQDVSIFFPVDRLDSGLGEELICFMHLDAKPDRNWPDRLSATNHLRDALAEFARHAVPTCRLVEVFDMPFDRTTQGFSDLAIKPRSTRLQPVARGIAISTSSPQDDPAA